MDMCRGQTPGREGHGDRHRNRRNTGTGLLSPVSPEALLLWCHRFPSGPRWCSTAGSTTGSSGGGHTGGTVTLTCTPRTSVLLSVLPCLTTHPGTPESSICLSIHPSLPSSMPPFFCPKPLFFHPNPTFFSLQSSLIISWVVTLQASVGQGGHSLGKMGEKKEVMGWGKGEKRGNGI